MTAFKKLTRGLRWVASDIAQGFFEITHNGFAMLGRLTMSAVLVPTARPESRHAGALKWHNWVKDGQLAVGGPEVESDADARAPHHKPNSHYQHQEDHQYWQEQ